MRSDLWKLILVGALALAVLVPGVTMAQEEETAEEVREAEAAAEEAYEVDEEIVVVGTRSEGRSVSDSPVPVDVISSDDFNAIANNADLTDNLKMLVPSYTATPATGDGSAFIRPTSLRGTAPDQVLVLVNGKRRHRTSLVHLFAPAAGNGAHGVDIGMIPGMAIKRVEVLRDGAASQYGSDAIAGVINFEMKDNSEGGEVQVQYGQFYEDENSFMAGANAGFSLGQNGFFNLTLEAFDNDGLSRGIQRADAQALIDAGVPGVGEDAVFGDAPLVQSWGRPASEGVRAFINMGTLVGDTSQWYLFGNYGQTEGRYRFFYRTPNHSSLAPLRAQGYTGLPGGYTPYLDGDQSDLSLVTGITGVMGSDMIYDFSIGYGENELDYFLNNTINPSLGLGPDGEPAQRDFDVGDLGQDEINVNADFSKPLTDSLNLAFGAEWREETFTLKAGEPNSYQAPGSNGFPGLQPKDSGSFSRDNFALYVDLEHFITENVMLQYALRWEDYSDFGSTVNGKLAGRFSLSETFALRGAVSTGFHAPTPGQSNYQQTITTFDGVTGLQQDERLVPAASPIAEPFGGKPLTEETSTNFSVGFTTQLGDRTTLTLDGYLIDIEDRIYRTGDIAVPENPAIDSISFYTNTLGIESTGIDLVLDSGFNWGSSDVRTDWSFVFSYNKLSVTDQKFVETDDGTLIQPVSDATVEDIENNYPNDRFVLNTITSFDEAWSFLLRLNYYGSHWDERGTIGAAVDPSAEIGSTLYTDVEVNYQFNESIGLALGAINVFDEYIDEIGPPNANRLSVGLQYPRRSVANYEGGSAYLRLRYRW